MTVQYKRSIEVLKRAMESYDFMALFFVLLPVRGWTRTAGNWYVALVQAFFSLIHLRSSKKNVFTGLAEI